MNSVQVLRGFALLVFALIFWWQAFELPRGSLSNPGPGLFPMIVTGLLVAIAVLLLIQSRFEEAEPAELNLRNIGLVVIALVGFAFLAHWSVIPAVVFLVFVSSAAGTGYSVSRCVKLSAALILIAAGFRFGLGLNLQFF